MGLEFSFDEISLDQKVSRDQLEIDLYDELITISDAEPEEQVSLLAVKPAVPVVQADDKPESIRITGSLGKEHLLMATPVSPAPTAAEQIEIAVDARPANVARPQSIPAPYPPPVGAGPGFPVAPPAPNGPRSAPTQPSDQTPGPSPKPKEVQPPPQAAAPIFTRSKELQPPLPVPPAPRVPLASANASASSCPDCGNPAGELDMICIDCGAFIG